MRYKPVLPIAVVAFTLAACGGPPGKGQVQKAMDQYAKATPMMFGSAKPVVKDAKCAKAGQDMYTCVAAIATTKDPQPMTVSLRLTKLNGKWTAQLTGLPGFGSAAGL
jgi:hypothetical protein